MTVATRHPAPHAYEASTPPAFTPIARAMRDDELPWAIHSWGQAWKDSPANRSRTWGDYKAHHLSPIRDALCRADCMRVAIEGPAPGRAIGWLALSRRPGYDAVHWVYVSRQYRRARSRGVAPFGAMVGLLGHVVLQRSVVYTFQAACDSKLPPRPNVPGETGCRLGRNDVWLAEYLRDRGHTVSYEPFAEWSR